MINQCHFIGIGGIGMSGLAKLMLSRNAEVTGSDLASNYVTEGLVKGGAKVYIGHSSKYIKPGMTVVYSSDIKKDNPEFQAALNMKCEMLHRSDLLVQLMQDYKTLAVAGTHGKTTTSAMLTSVLSKANFDPAFAVGGIIPQFDSNAGHGEGEHFVAEADESDGTFLKYNPYGAIVTNIDLDHMNYFGSESELVVAFKSFMSKVKSAEHLFWCGDDPRLKSLMMPGVSYGFGKHCEVRALRWEQRGWKIAFDAKFKGKTYIDIEAPLVGKHNVLNALAVFGLSLSLGIDESAARAGLRSFQGVKRRCEKKGEFRDVLLLDDYAHHPTEIRTTLHGIRLAIQERRLIAVYQPHRYSRTKDCLGTFGGIFDDADEVILTDIYAAGEPEIPGLSYKQVLEEIQATAGIPCRYVPRERLVSALAAFLRPHDVMVTLGAGDVTKVGGDLAEMFVLSPPKKLKVGVIFGGRSVEHEVSLRSGRNICESLNQDIYDIECYGIAKDGSWAYNVDLNDQVKMIPPSEKGPTEAMGPEVITHLLECDILFPIMHGPFGEDGTVQGFLDILGKPYIGADHRACAVCMDKALTKNLMVYHGIATPPFVSFNLHEWKTESERILSQIHQTLRFPLFVKPTHLGSSVGVTKVEHEGQLQQAVANAFKFDTHVLVENGIQGRELEFAVLGNDEIHVFPPGEICSEGKVYDYESKYGHNSTKTESVASISDEICAEGKRLAHRAYKVTGCTGMARIDFFLDQDGKLWLNEINPIPGFTSISLYPKICEAHGLDAAQLVDRLIILGLHRRRAQRNYLSVG